jgi:hypothetical protein
MAEPACLDNNGTTPIDPRAVDAMKPAAPGSGGTYILCPEGLKGLDGVQILLTKQTIKGINGRTILNFLY